MAQTMTIERARQINKAIGQACFRAMGFDGSDLLASLAGVALSEMIEAARIINAENDAAAAMGGSYSITAVPDDRLIAAVYTLANYDGNRQIIALGGGRALAVVPESALQASED